MNPMAFSLYLKQEGVDPQSGESWEEDPVFLHLTYDSNLEAEQAKATLETVYGPGKIEIDQSQDYQARMGWF